MRPAGAWSLLTVALIAAVPCGAGAAAAKHRPAADAAPAGMVLIPAGPFVMGSNKTDASMADQYATAKPFYDNEHPRHSATLPAFYMDRYEVTNAQYRDFVDGANHPPPDYWIYGGYLLSMTPDKVKALSVEHIRHLVTRVFKLDVDTRTMTKAQLLAAIDKRYAYMDKLPVTNVSWYDAHDYCAWAHKRLPREAEWEKAARGKDGRQFPWGDKWKAGMSNTGEESWDDGVAPVGSYKTDKSPYGVYDMAGNVREWVQDWYRPYPGSDYHSKDFGTQYKVMRGAGWGREGHYQLSEFERGGYRFYLDPQAAATDVGFRCAADVSPGAAAAAR